MTGLLNSCYGKIFLVHATKAHRGNGGIDPLIFNVGTRCRKKVYFTHRLLYLGNIPGTNWIRGWLGPTAGAGVQQKRNISCSCQESKPGRPSGLDAMPQNIEIKFYFVYQGESWAGLRIWMCDKIARYFWGLQRHSASQSPLMPELVVGAYIVPIMLKKGQF